MLIYGITFSDHLKDVRQVLGEYDNVNLPLAILGLSMSQTVKLSLCREHIPCAKVAGLFFVFAKFFVKPIDPFHNDIQFEAKDVIPCAARYLRHIIMLQQHILNNFMCC